MKTAKLLLFLSGSVGLIAFSGCDTTPQARISEHPGEFAQLTPQQQQQVRAGQVAIGMDMDAVRLALGDPDEVTNRTDTQGISQVWHYFTYGYYDGTYLYGGPYWGPRGRRRWGGGWGWDAGFSAYPGPVTTYPRYRIVFANGKVTRIEQDVPASG
jgi:hypothetical protein